MRPTHFNHTQMEDWDGNKFLLQPLSELHLWNPVQQIQMANADAHGSSLADAGGSVESSGTSVILSIQLQKQE